jgi:hypothetical protein
MEAVVARDGDSMCGSSRRMEAVGRQMELDERCRVWGCARASCVCAVQSSSKTEDNWTCVCAANQTKARLEHRHWAPTSRTSQNDDRSGGCMSGRTNTLQPFKLRHEVPV